MSKDYLISEDTIYCYLGTDILKNKASIKNNHDLELYERKVVAYQLSMMEVKPVKGDFDFEHLKKIHRELFKDIYVWAGKERSISISKGITFCLPRFISGIAEELFTNLKKEQYLLPSSPEHFVEKLSYYLGELNALHPFREGNGRTQREFVRLLAAVNGYELNFNTTTKEEMNHASQQSYLKKYEEMESILHQSLTPVSHQEHLQHLKTILRPKSDVYKMVLEHVTNATNKGNSDRKHKPKSNLQDKLMEFEKKMSQQEVSSKNRIKSKSGEER